MSLCEYACENVYDMEVVVSVNWLCRDFGLSVGEYEYVSYVVSATGFWLPFVHVVQNLKSARGARWSLDYSQLFFSMLLCCLPQSPFLQWGCEYRTSCELD